MMPKRSRAMIGIALLMLCIGAAIGFFFNSASLFTKNSDPHKEFSYKTDQFESRYVRSFKRVTQRYPEDISNQQSAFGKKANTAEQSLKESVQLAKKFAWFKQIQHEHAFVYLTDAGFARFTLDIDGGAATVSRGFDTSRKPTLVVPLATDAINNLRSILSHQTLSYEDLYQIYNALAVPALQGLYDADPLYTPGDKSVLQFDDLVQIVIPPEKPVAYNGTPLNIELTAANVDGQWLVFRGLQGDPDFKLSLTLDQATSLYVMGVYGVRNIKNPADVFTLSKQFLQFINTTKTYTRNDHLK